MKVLLQWTKLSPEGWVEFDLRSFGPARKAWDNLLVKPEPTGGETLDNAEGWVFDINVQGVVFAGNDHYTLRPTSTGVEVTTWNDDPADWPVGTRNAAVWSFHPLRSDPRYGQLNTEQYLTVYDERAPSPWVGHSTSGGPVVIRPWSEFVIPTTKAIHGIWVSDALADAHRSVRPLRGWRDW